MTQDEVMSVGRPCHKAVPNDYGFEWVSSNEVTRGTQIPVQHSEDEYIVLMCCERTNSGAGYCRNTFGVRVRPVNERQSSILMSELLHSLNTIGFDTLIARIADVRYGAHRLDLSEEDSRTISTWALEPGPRQRVFCPEHRSQERAHR